MTVNSLNISGSLVKRISKKFTDFKLHKITPKKKKEKKRAVNYMPRGHIKSQRWYRFWCPLDIKSSMLSCFQFLKQLTSACLLFSVDCVTSFSISSHQQHDKAAVPLNKEAYRCFTPKNC